MPVSFSSRMVLISTLRITVNGHLFTMRHITVMLASATPFSSGRLTMMSCVRSAQPKTNWLSTYVRVIALSMHSSISGDPVKMETSTCAEFSLERVKMSMSRLRLWRILHCTSQLSMVIFWSLSSWSIMVLCQTSPTAMVSIHTNSHINPLKSYQLRLSTMVDKARDSKSLSWKQLRSSQVCKTSAL